MSKPCAFCANRVDCKAERSSCAVWHGSDVEYVRFEPWHGSYQESEENDG